jgi:hypothetical protein
LSSTSAIVGFTYFMGVFVVIITGQIDITNVINLRLLIIVSVFVIGFASIFFLRGYNKVKRISRAIRTMISEENIRR